MIGQYSRGNKREPPCLGAHGERGPASGAAESPVLQHASDACRHAGVKAASVKDGDKIITK